MNLIYVCVFHQESYIKLLNLLIQTINDNSNINKENTNILISTSESFLPAIKESVSKFDIKIDYYLLDLHTIFDAGCARLHIFNYEKIDLYEKILYLDTDILIYGDLNTVFNLDILDSKLYAVEEGFIGGEFWGGPAFFSFPPYDYNLPAFSSGVLYFKNSKEIKELFANIISHINTYIYLNNNAVPICLDQPFIVYNAISEDKYDNKLLTSYSVLTPTNISPDIIIYHFAGGPGHFSSKYEKMVEFMGRSHNLPPQESLNYESKRNPDNIHAGARGSIARSGPVKICQYGTDGFGHQLEGMLRMLSISLNGKAEYMYHFRKSYSFQHSNFNLDRLTNYFQTALENMSSKVCDSIDYSQYNVIYNETRNFNDIIENDVNYDSNVYFYDGVGSGISLPPYFENKTELTRSLSTLRIAFVDKNPHLPLPSYSVGTPVQNVCCHIRKGDAEGTRVLDNVSLMNVVRHYQKMPNVHITVHSDGDVDCLKNDNTVIMSLETDVLQVLSDFIHADVLIMNYSGLSMSAHLLAKPSQIVIRPNVAGVTFFDRILDKCIRVEDFLKPYVLESSEIPYVLDNRTYSWQNDSITFFRNGQMNAFGMGEYVKTGNYTIRAFFGGRIHNITFDSEYKTFSSVREEDNYLVTGCYVCP